MDVESESLDVLSSSLNALSQNSYDISLHAQHICAAQKLHSLDPTHLDAAREMFIAHFPATDDIWLPLLTAKEESVNLSDLEGILDVMELYTKAEADYLCMLTVAFGSGIRAYGPRYYIAIPILQKHIQFLIDRHAWLSTLDAKPEEFSELFSTEWTRAMMASVITKGAHHLTEVRQKSLNLYLKWSKCALIRAIYYGTYVENGRCSFSKQLKRLRSKLFSIV